MKLKFVHAITDEKFIEYARLSFEKAALTEDKYILISDKKNLTFNYLNNFKGGIQILTPYEFRQSFESEDFGDVLVLHNLYSVPLETIRLIPRRIKIVWLSWGFDIYSNPFPGYPLLDIGERIMPETKKLLESNKSLESKLKKIIKVLVSYVSPTYSKKCFEEAIERIDFFSGVYEIEYDMMKQQVPFFRAEKLVYNYSFMKESINNDYEIKEGNDIMIGNCASPFCNHLDLLGLVKERLDGCVDKIICPLSYGQKGFYTNAVMSEGERLFGSRFIPLTSFLPLDDYLKIINNCAGMVLGLFQQSAVGNVTSGLSDGINVYVPIKSMNYKYFSKLGTAIKSIENDMTPSLFKSRTAYNDVMRDRKIIFDTFHSRERCMKNIFSMVETIKRSI